MSDSPQAPTAAQPATPVSSTVAEIASRLGETDPEALSMIGRLIETFGVDFARLVLQETLEIEAHGGRRVMSKARRRSPGGVFFELVASRVARWRRSVKAHEVRRGIRPESSTNSSPAFEWDERIELFAEAGKQKGQASSVKMTVIGRPASIVKRGTFVVAALEARKTPSLPKGLPVPPASPTTFTVFMTAKHWNKVEAAVQSPEDVLIVEGFPTLDAEAKTICVFATNTTTKLLQQAGKAEKPGAGGEG